jgi:hypothetical protein
MAFSGKLCEVILFLQNEIIYSNPFSLDTLMDSLLKTVVMSSDL